MTRGHHLLCEPHVNKLTYHNFAFVISVLPLLQVAFLTLFLAPDKANISKFAVAIGTVRALRQVIKPHSQVTILKRLMRFHRWITRYESYLEVHCCACTFAVIIIIIIIIIIMIMMMMMIIIININFLL